MCKINCNVNVYSELSNIFLLYGLNGKTAAALDNVNR